MAPVASCLLFLTSLSLAAAASLPKRAEGFPVSAADRNAVLCVASAVAQCTDLHIQDLTVPPNTTLDLSKVKANTVITFEGRTFWQWANATYDLLKVGGTNITIQGAACSVLDGNGPAWWDGIGSNGGVPKPDHMITGSKLLGNSVIKNLYIKNAPTHVFSISGAFGLVMKAIVIDMKEGYTLLPSGLAAAHNTDGFDVSSSTDMLITNNLVFNQDDCIAITSGGGLVATNMYCSGGHGLSIGSIGGKSNNTVDGVIFSNSKVINSQNGARIKCNSGTAGVVNNVTYQNIQLFNMSTYGIDIQQDYLNGGPTGIPTPGVNITNIVMNNIHGTAQPGAENYYILTAAGTTADTWKFSDIDITGGDTNTCVLHPAGLSC
ncbi:glycoside hydrolase family 28 protein [Calocera cornea HHB12733]|uniref:endo-polygalacturonase n=1 Tax=Calocera cornea HHB12733 TaxID=1353952 RepID=A0A165ESY9_9BASI|nr:glycoside hydrolase family 28 protein [Calocera cornea HHB12733]